MLTSRKNKLNQYWFFDLISITLTLGFFYALWIGTHPLFTPDEGRYSEIAREMIATRDYITPRLNGVVFLDKPILYYWLQVIAIKLFGLKEWALRFWPACVGMLACVITYITGRILFDRRTGILAAIILATSPLYYGAAHYANLDLEVAGLIGSSLLCFITAMQFPLGRYRDAFLIAAYIFSGLAFLTKGLIGIVFPVFIIGSWIVILKRWNTLATMRLIPGLLIFLIITIPWYVLAQRANPEFLHFFFVTQQVSRFLTMEDFNNKTAAWFYIPVVLMGFFPWSIFIIQAVTEKIKLVWEKQEQRSIDLFLLLWFFIIFIFFSIPKSKTVGYILPIFPCLALMTGNYLSHLWVTQKSKGFYAGIYVFVATCLIAAVALTYIPSTKLFNITPDIVPYFFMLAIIFSIAGMNILLLRKEKLIILFACLTLTSVVILLTIISNLSVFNHKTTKPLALQLNTFLRPEDEVVTFYKYYQDLPIYIQRQIVIVADWKSPEIPYKDNWVRELWYGMAFQNTQNWLIDENTFWQRWNSNKRLFVLTETSYYNEMLAKTRDVYLLGRINNIVLISNKPQKH